MKLFIYHARQCDPGACTGMKLKKFGLAEVFYNFRSIPKNSIILSPFTDKAISIEDNRYKKLVALDCSWKHATEVFQNLRTPMHQRILPLLLASNPVNYGKVSKLSTAEALSSALYILGCIKEANAVLSKFKWGATFFELNGELLESYSKAKNSREILKIQREYFRSVTKWPGSQKQKKDYFM